MSDITEIMKGWKFSKEHVDQSINSGRFISSKTVLLVAINNLSDVIGDIQAGNPIGEGGVQGTPIGVITNWTISQQKQIQQLFEVGSGLPYFIPGNTTATVALSRVIYSGGTILGNLYNFAGMSGANADSEKEEAGFRITGTNEWFAINLAAKTFDRPTTLMWIMQNNEGNKVGAYLFKNAYIESHVINSDSTSIVIMENATMRFESAYPIKLGK